MSYKDSFIWQACKVMTIWLSIFYILWVSREIVDGELLTGVIMCFCFGAIWIYLAKAWEDWQHHKSKLQTVLSVLIAGYFGALWYYLLKELNAHLITGDPLPIATSNYKGLFNIEGFWGLGIVIPIYIGFVVLIVTIFCIYDKWVDYRYNWTNRRYQQIKDKLEGR